MAFAALVYAVAVVEVVADTPAATTYHGVSGILAAADLAAGLGLLAAGVVAFWLRSRSPAGVLATLAGAVWFAPDWEAWPTGPAGVRSLAMVSATFLLPLLLHLVLAFPHTRVDGLARRAVAAAYACALTVAVGRAVLRDPFLDPDCLRNCTDNVFLLHAESSLARLLDGVEHVAALAAGAVMAGVAAARLARATRTARRVLGPVEAPGVLVGATAAVSAALLLVGPPELPADPGFAALFLLRSAAVIALALGLGLSVTQERRIRSAVVGLATDLGVAPRPGSLRSVLAEALADPHLLIAYGRSERDGYIDVEGLPIELPAPAAGRASTSIVREGRELAVVVHDATLLPPAELRREIGAAVRLAVENEQLAAEALAQMHELRQSRSRIVETGDDERRRLERDLHDGAQQRLLTLSYRLRLAAAAATSAGRADLAAPLGDAVDRSLAALAALRELAHGIYPAVLAESGLAPALTTLAGHAALPVEIAGLDVGRYPAAVETAAYMTVLEAVHDAARRGATHAAVRVARSHSGLVVEVRDDATAAPAPSLSLAERVGALGGRLGAQPSIVLAEIPCA